MAVPQTPGRVSKFDRAEATKTAWQADRTHRPRYSEIVAMALLRLSGIALLAALACIVAWIVRGGSGAISWEFLTQVPRRGMTEGGVWPAIVGTTYVSLGTIFISVPMGIATAIYLVEYAKPGALTRVIRLSLRNLSGVPSIVYGLFGLGLFVAAMRLGSSILAASLTLSLMTLPWIVTASEEALRSVPASFREGAYALGATKWQAIRYQVLPSALPGIATGSILGLARAAGETAPILLTGAAFFLPHLPRSIFDQFMALPYHLYVLATQHHAVTTVRPLAWGTALVLVALVLILNGVVIALRARARARKLW